MGADPVPRNSSYTTLLDQLFEPLERRPGSITEQLLRPGRRRGATWVGEQQEQRVSTLDSVQSLDVRSQQREESTVDREALERDRLLYGTSFETIGGRRLDPTIVRITDGPASGWARAQQEVEGWMSERIANAFRMELGDSYRISITADQLAGGPLSSTDPNPATADAATMPPGVRPAPEDPPMMGLRPRPGRDDQGKIEAAVISRIAGMELEPGVAVSIRSDGRAIECGTKNRDGSVNADWAGIVDPFLVGNVMEGTAFWMLQRLPVRVAVPDRPAPEIPRSRQILISGQVLPVTSVHHQLDLHGGRIATTIVLPGRHSLNLTSVSRPRLHLEGEEYAIQSTRTTQIQTTIHCRRVSTENGSAAGSSEALSEIAEASPLRLEDVVGVLNSVRASGSDPREVIVSNDAYRMLLADRSGSFAPHLDPVDGVGRLWGLPVSLSTSMAPHQQFYVTSSRRRLPSDLLAGPTLPRDQVLPHHALVARRATVYRGRTYLEGQEYRSSGIREAIDMVATGRWSYGRAAPMSTQGYTADAARNEVYEVSMSEARQRRASRPRHTDDPPDLGEDQ